MVNPSPTPVVTQNKPYDVLVSKHFGEAARVAYAVMTAENGAHRNEAINTNRDSGTLTGKSWDVYFKGGTIDVGLFQINMYWNWEKIPGDSYEDKLASLKNPEINVEIAAKIYRSWGNSFAAWSTYKNRSYLKYL
jgi:hypothetical protein